MKAIKLCEDGIKYDEKDRPGLVKRWYDGLLDIALHQGNSEKLLLMRGCGLSITFIQNMIITPF